MKTPAIIEVLMTDQGEVSYRLRPIEGLSTASYGEILCDLMNHIARMISQEHPQLPPAEVVYREIVNATIHAIEERPYIPPDDTRVLQ
jgi:hypothetical protein